MQASRRTPYPHQMFQSLHVKLLAECYRLRRKKSARQRSFPLTPQQILSDINQEELEAIRSQHVIPNPGIRIEKYLEMDKWLGINVRRIFNLGLDFEPKRRILDLGCGAGYFLHISKRLGHDVLGLDIPEPAWYGDITRLLGVSRVIQRIERCTALPDLGEPFDLVTGFMVCFNDHIAETPWGIAEWRFFLDDLWTRLRPGAVVWFELNPGRDGTHYTPELKSFFEERGAIVDRNRLVWGMETSRSLALKRLASKMEA